MDSVLDLAEAVTRHSVHLELAHQLLDVVVQLQAHLEGAAMFHIDADLQKTSSKFPFLSLKRSKFTQTVNFKFKNLKMDTNSHF